MRTDFLRNLDKLYVDNWLLEVNVGYYELFRDDPCLVRVPHDLPVHGPVECWWWVPSAEITKN